MSEHIRYDIQSHYLPFNEVVLYDGIDYRYAEYNYFAAEHAAIIERYMNAENAKYRQTQNTGKRPYKCTM